MILLIDIGNSRVKFAIADETGRTPKIVLSTAMLVEEPLDVFILEYICRHKDALEKVSTALISSVVPYCNDIVVKACIRLGIKPLFVTQDVVLPIKTAFEIPPMTGVDRLLLAYGAMALYPNTPCIIVSYGTATTFNCVENDTFLGGLIFAGVMQSLYSLTGTASQLEPIMLHDRNSTLSSYIAQNVTDSLHVGFTEGFASMTEGILQKLSASFKAKPLYICAGGMAPLMSTYTDVFTDMHEDLVLDGLYHLSKICRNI